MLPPGNDLLPHTEDRELACWEDDRRGSRGCLALWRAHCRGTTRCSWQVKYWSLWQTKSLNNLPLSRFRDGLEKILITTNVLSRGIDIEQVDWKFTSCRHPSQCFRWPLWWTLTFQWTWTAKLIARHTCTGSAGPADLERFGDPLIIQC